VSEARTCPSGHCTPGALVLGVVHDGTVRFVNPPLVVDEDFVTRADPVSARRRFRFAEPCREGGCVQWRDGRCTVIDDVLDEAPAPAATDGPLPTCRIRPTCRWFAQSGRAACQSCRLVITETLEVIPASGAIGREPS
jgi:hypothetical protein